MKRLKYVDVARLIAVLFILFDHIQYYIPVSSAYMALRVVWLSFFLQILYMVSGLVGNFPHLTCFNDLKCFIMKKFKSLIIPYFLWCFFLNYTGVHDLNFFVNIFIGTNSSLDKAGVNSVLWFLPTLFLANIFVLFIINLCEKLFYTYKKVILAIIAVFLCYMGAFLSNYFENGIWFGLNVALIGSSFILIGYLLKPLMERLYSARISLKILCFAILLCIGIFISYYNMPIVLNPDNTITYTYAVWLARGYVGKNVLLFLISGLTLSIAVLCFSMCIENILFLNYLGTHTLLFMTEHIYTHSLTATYIVPLFNATNGSVYSLLIMFFASVAMIILTLPFIDKFMPFLYKPLKN